METVRLVDLVDENLIIERQTFEDLLVLGPAVIAPLESVTFEEDTFEGEDLESLLIEVPVGRRLTGVVGLREVTFRRCRFRNIAVLGARETLESFRANVSVVQPAVTVS
jgi:hypothetical protein